MLSKQELIDFEADIAREFEAGNIRAPVHLHGGNEEALIEIFKEIKSMDYVFSTHRSHYHALLHGVPADKVKAEIMAGHSISLQFPEYHFFTSAIVAGICPIALGVAMTGQKCWVFVGDMAAQTGIFHECAKYAFQHSLPIYFITEDNGLSVDTPTEKVWGDTDYWQEEFDEWLGKYSYLYDRTYPHQGAGKWVTF